MARPKQADVRLQKYIEALHQDIVNAKNAYEARKTALEIAGDQLNFANRALELFNGFINPVAPVHFAEADAPKPTRKKRALKELIGDRPSIDAQIDVELKRLTDMNFDPDSILVNGAGCTVANIHEQEPDDKENALRVLRMQK